MLQQRCHFEPAPAIYYTVILINQISVFYRAHQEKIMLTLWLSPVQTLDILHSSTSLEWEEWPPLPVKMRGASSMYLNGILYVGGGLTDKPSYRADASLYSFKPGVDSTWTVTDTPTYFYTLVVHDSELLLVGGREYPTKEITNKVFTMRDGQFVEVLPPMKERRESSSAVSSGSGLVVAGGLGTSGGLSSVEVFKDGQWTTAPSLPSAGSVLQSALHGDQWYLITSFGKVFRTSLQSLISGADQSPWETLPDAPNSSSAAAFFGGRLLSIGGGDYGNPTTAIYAFSSSTQSWVHVAGLPLPLGESSAVVLPTGELLVIGGKDKRGNCNDKVLRAFLKGKTNYKQLRYHYCDYANHIFFIQQHWLTVMYNSSAYPSCINCTSMELISWKFSLKIDIDSTLPQEYSF